MVQDDAVEDRPTGFSSPVAPETRDVLYDVLDRLDDIADAVDQLRQRSAPTFLREASGADLDSGDAELIDAEVMPLATFALPNGNELQFLGAPTLGEVVVGEIADCGLEEFIVDAHVPPAELFHYVAPKGLPVPRMLYALDEGKRLSDRQVVEGLEEMEEASMARPSGKADPQQASAANGGSCQPGTAGANYFAAQHCGTGGGPGYGKSESYCYNGHWTSVQKTSDDRMRATYTRMASCGTGQNRLRHYYGTVSGFHTQLTIYVQAPKVATYWTYKKGRTRFRRVRMEAMSQGGWVRGWIKYHRQVAGGW